MPAKRQPIELLKVKGKKHLTKDEIEQREREEIKVESKEIQIPDYLPEELHNEFREVADRLFEIGIFTDLDVDGLARYVMSKQVYLTYSYRLANVSKNTHIDTIVKLSNIQDKAFKQCRSAAGDLGLTISSRCKLVIPEKQKEDDVLLKVLRGG
jgi:P27 family predicted phage terminase small subunit